MWIWERRAASGKSDYKAISHLKMSNTESRGFGKGISNDNGLGNYFDEITVPALEVMGGGHEKSQAVDFAENGKTRDDFRKAFEAIISRKHSRKENFWKRHPGGSNPINMPKSKVYKSTTPTTVKSDRNVIRSIFSGRKDPIVYARFYPFPVKKFYADCWQNCPRKEQQNVSFHQYISGFSGVAVSLATRILLGLINLMNQNNDSKGYVYDIPNGAITRNKSQG